MPHTGHITWASVRMPRILAIGLVAHKDGHYIGDRVFRAAPLRLVLVRLCACPSRAVDSALERGLS
jgi:hypothetical protein